MCACVVSLSCLSATVCASAGASHGSQTNSGRQTNETTHQRMHARHVSVCPSRHSSRPHTLTDKSTAHPHTLTNSLPGALTRSNQRTHTFPLPPPLSATLTHEREMQRMAGSQQTDRQTDLHSGRQTLTQPPLPPSCPILSAPSIHPSILHPPIQPWNYLIINHFRMARFLGAALALPLLGLRHLLAGWQRWQR